MLDIVRVLYCRHSVLFHMPRWAEGALGEQALRRTLARITAHGPRGEEKAEASNPRCHRQKAKASNSRCFAGICI
jgi:hypothetical protein